MRFFRRLKGLVGGPRKEFLELVSTVQDLSSDVGRLERAVGAISQKVHRAGKADEAEIDDEVKAGLLASIDKGPGKGDGPVGSQVAQRLYNPYLDGGK